MKSITGGRKSIGRWRCARVLQALNLAILAATLVWAHPALAQQQAFPTRTVRIIVPYAPGASADFVARVIANELSSRWPHQVMVDNRPGGNTMIGMEAVARAEPDGHTLLFTSDDSFTIVPHLTKKAPVDPIKDLTPVNLSARVSMVIVANASVPVDSLPALIERARTNPASVSYGSYGTGGSVHLAMETLKSLAKVDILHVPYKGVAPAITAVVAGEVSVALSGYGTARGHIETGRIKPLAIASPERIPELPKVPTTRELGYGEVDSTVWWGFAAPAKTSPEMVNRIHEAISRALNNPEVRKTIEARSLGVADLGPKPFAEQIAREYRARAEAVRRFAKPE
jgi:tripartite-type tricarboxylate transporter receptor subunit TctC